MTNPRRKFSAEETVQILRLHLLEKQPVSDVILSTGRFANQSPRQTLKLSYSEPKRSLPVAMPNSPPPEKHARQDAKHRDE